MPNQNFLIFIILAILIILIGYLIFQTFKIKRRLDVFFSKGGKNLETFLKDQNKKLEKQEKDLKKIFSSVSELEEISKKTFQKIGIVRYNPFSDVGGDQSFSIALLDSQDNGFVITSLYSREGNRVYGKPIGKGVSQYSLSEEEREAISRATGS